MEEEILHFFSPILYFISGLASRRSFVRNWSLRHKIRNIFTNKNLLFINIIVIPEEIKGSYGVILLPPHL